MKSHIHESLQLIKQVAFGDSIEDGDSLENEKLNKDGKPNNNFKTPTTDSLSFQNNSSNMTKD
jgi:hypothetical protein